MQPNPHEIFTVYDASNRPLTNAPRQRVHRDGLYHRAVHVLLFNDAGEVLLQRRSTAKDVCPDCWDLSCGEHLQPGETYQDAAWRGLSEELRVRPTNLVRVGQPHLQEYLAPGIQDREFVELYKGRFSGAIAPTHDEVGSVRWVRPKRLRRVMQRLPLRFTPWLHSELIYLSQQ